MKWTLLFVCVGLLAVGCGEKEEPVANDPAKKPSRPAMLDPGSKTAEPVFGDEKPATQPAKE
jgi:hypothetical protein